jgi:hypothetical protein
MLHRGEHRYLAGILPTEAWGRGGIGRRTGLKIRVLTECGFESHRPYSTKVSGYSMNP